MSGNVPIPYLETLGGEIRYLRYTLDTANGGETQVGVGTGFGLFFPVRLTTEPPVINVHPRAVVAPVGATVPLRIEVQPNETLKFRVLKNGAQADNSPPNPFPNPTNPFQTFNVQITRPEDAGLYTIEVSNPAGIAISKPAQIAIMPHVNLAVLAGSVEKGSADGTGVSARFNGPRGIAVLPSGELIVADTGNHTLRRITQAGAVSTFAGAAGQSGTADGTTASARFNSPAAIAVDPAGTIFVADSGNRTVRKITPDGTVTTFAGRAGEQGVNDGPAGIARFGFFSSLVLDPVGNLLTSDPVNHTIRRISPDGNTATLTRYDQPSGLAIDRVGNVFISDRNGIHRISPTGRIETIVGSFFAPVACVETGRGDGLLSPSFGLSVLSGIVTDESGAVIAAVGSLLRRIIPGGTMVTINTGPEAFSAPPQLPSTELPLSISALAMGPDGTIFVTDVLSNTVRRGRATSGSTSPMIEFVGADQSHVVASGTTAALPANANGPGLSYQWFKDGVSLRGITDAILHLSPATENDAGTYSVLVGNGVGAVMSAPKQVVVSRTANVGRLQNLSVRTYASVDDDTLIVGFVVGGSTIGTSNVLLRGIGPSLADFGLTGVLSDPRIALLRGSAIVASNDDWGGGATMRTAFSMAGAFPLAPASGDSALTSTLSSGNYSLHLTGAGSGSGAVLAEIYELSNNAVLSGSRLINLSTRGLTGNGARALIVGFVVSGSASKTFLIRGIGSGLKGFGVQGFLNDPRLDIFKDGALIASTDDMQSSETLDKIIRTIGAFPQFPGPDAAIALSLTPGAYTVHISSSDGKLGVALAEIYEVP